MPPRIFASSGSRAAFAARLASYRFLKYRTTLKPDKTPSVETIRIVAAARPRKPDFLLPLGLPRQLPHEAVDEIVQVLPVRRRRNRVNP